MTELIITNGDSTVSLMHAAGLHGQIIPWRDVLHDGPFLSTNTLDEQVDVRVSFLVSRFGLKSANVRESFEERNSMVNAWADYDHISLWFEHDLYDQLQILEVLAALKGTGCPVDKIRLMQAHDYLGEMTPEAIGCLQKEIRPLTSTQYDLADTA
jgi:hypothetical protein